MIRIVQLEDGRIAIVTMEGGEEVLHIIDPSTVRRWREEPAKVLPFKPEDKKGPEGSGEE